RMPITAAWSTPGAALLAAISTVDGGWPAAVGAFLVVAALILLTALVPRVGAVIAAIPPSIAQAMLAGVLLPLCLAPITGLTENPWGVVPVLLTWLMFARLAPRWAVPARSEEHTSELQSRENLVCRLLLEKKNPQLYTAAR